MSAVLSPPLAAAPATTYKIVTASERGTYIEIGRDLGRFVAPDAGLQLEALPSKGSADNVRRLRYDAGVKFAMCNPMSIRPSSTTPKQATQRPPS